MVETRRPQNVKYPAPKVGLFSYRNAGKAYRRQGPGISSQRRRGPDRYWSVLGRPAVIPDTLGGACRPQNVKYPAYR